MLSQNQTPTTPVISTVGHALAGGTADSSTPVIGGTGDAGNIIMLYDGIRLLGTAVVSANGTWTFSTTVALKAGSHSFTALATNPDTGAGSNSSATFSSVIPSSTVVLPDPPSISGVTDNVGPTTGPVPKNGSTDDNHPAINGKGVPGDIVHVKDNGVEIGTTTVNPSGDWTFKPTVPLAEGPHDITAAQTDPATGATSNPSADFPFNVDTSIPPAPSITQVLDSVGAITGPVAKNGTTDDNDPVISGKGVAGDIVHVKDNGVEIGTTTVNGSGDWSLKPATALADGAHDITATQTNPATGATSVPSADWPFNVSTVPAPVITTMAEYASDGQGLGEFPSGSQAPSSNVRLAGTATANAVVYLYDGNTLLASTTANSSGAWVYMNTTWALGGHDVTATQKINNGAESAHSNHWTFSVGNIPAPNETITITNVIDHTMGNVSVGNNGSISDTSPTVQGTLSHALLAGETLVISRDGIQVGNASASGTSWSFNDSGLGLGTHRYFATVVGLGGVSPISNFFYINEITYSAPVPLETVNITNLIDHAAGNVSVGSGGSTRDTAPTVKGTLSSALLAGETLVIYRDGQKVGNATASGTGWTFNDSGVGVGSHTYTAQVENTAGHGPTSNSFAFNELTPVDPIVVPTETTTISYLLDHLTGSHVPTGGSMKDTAPQVVGTISSALLAGEQVAIWRDGALQGYATVSGTTWTFNDSGLSTGSHTYQARVESSGGVGPTSNTVVITELPPTPTETVNITNLIDDSSGSYVNIANGGSTKDTSPIVQGNVSHALLTGETLVVYRDGAKVGNATMSGTNWSFNDSGVAVGSHTYTARVENSAGNGSYSGGYSFTEAAPVTYPTVVVYKVLGVNDYVAGIWFHVDGATSMSVAGDVTYNGNGPTIYGNFQAWYRTIGYGIDGAGTFYSRYFGDGMIAPATGPFPINTYSSSTVVTISGRDTAGNAYKMTITWGELVASIPNVAGATTSYATAHPVALVSATHDVAAASALVDDSSSASLLGTSVTAPPVDAMHTVVGEHDGFVGKTGHDTVDLSADSSSYFKETTAHIEGSTVHPAAAAADGVRTQPSVNTLHLTGDHQILDLTSLTGQTAAAKVSGIEVIDLGGHHNTLKLSLVDVLNLGETDLFQKDGKQQMMVKGKEGDEVDLSNSHVAGVADGEWQAHGTAQVGGVTYNVYEHSGAHTELLIQQGVQIVVH